MYNILYEIWKKELESDELQKLSPDFYSKVAEYLRKIHEESRMLDKKGLKASFLRKETRNVKRMIREIMKMRYRKLIKIITGGKNIPSELLTTEEEKIFSTSSFAEAFRNFYKNVIRGSAPLVGMESTHKRAVLRFLKDIPSIVGSDMKAYGPFKAEDVASLPFENAKSLVERGLAERVKV